LTIDITARGELLHVEWEERGSTLVAETVIHEGFGTVLEKAALRGLQGVITREWKKSGLSLALKIPLASLAV
jgi:hypothetical protein